MTITNEQIAETLRAAIEKRGGTIKALAARIGMPHQTLYNVLSNQSPIKVGVALAIAGDFDVPLSVLVPGLAEGTFTMYDPDTKVLPEAVQEMFLTTLCEVAAIAQCHLGDLVAEIDDGDDV